MQPRCSREAPGCLQSRVRAGVAGVDPLANQRRLLKCPRAERAGCTAPTRLQQRSRQNSLAVCGEICGPDSLPRAVRPDAEGAQQLLEPGKLPARRERRHLRQSSEKVRGTRKAPLGASRLPEIAINAHDLGQSRVGRGQSRVISPTRARTPAAAGARPAWHGSAVWPPARAARRPALAPRPPPRARAARQSPVRDSREISEV